MFNKPQTSAIVLLLCFSFLLTWNWRIDHLAAVNLQQVVDVCVYKGGFVIETKKTLNKDAEIFGIVCGRAEEFHNKQIVQPYTVWPVWRLQ